MTNKTEFIKSMGVILGGIFGFLGSKIYQTWALNYNGKAYQDGTFMDGQEIIIWRYSVDYPTIFLFIIVTIFSVLGYLLAKKIIQLWNIKEV